MYNQKRYICYFNAPIQCLMATSGFTDTLLLPKAIKSDYKDEIRSNLLGLVRKYDLAKN